MRYEVGSFLYLLRGPGMDRYIHEGWKRTTLALRAIEMPFTHFWACGYPRQQYHGWVLFLRASPLTVVQLHDRLM
jgi:hypothetical protein